MATFLLRNRNKNVYYVFGDMHRYSTFNIYIVQSSPLLWHDLGILVLCVMYYVLLHTVRIILVGVVGELQEPRGKEDVEVKWRFMNRTENGSSYSQQNLRFRF